MAIAKKKKKFFDVEIPLIKKQTQLQGYEIKELDGKFIKYDLTRILRGKNIVVRLKVHVTENEAVASPDELKLLPNFLRRMVRKGTNYVEDSFSTDCKNAQIRIKPFLITRKKVSRAVRKALREKAKEELINYVKDKSSEDLFEEILRNGLQKPLSLKLKKIYPLSLCEIRVLKIEKEFEEIKEEVGKKEETKEQEKIKITEKTKEQTKEIKKEIIDKKEEPVKEKEDTKEKQ